MKLSYIPSEKQINRQGARLSVTATVDHVNRRANTMEAVAIILETLLRTNKCNSFPYDCLSVKSTENALVFILEHPSVENSAVYSVYEEKLNRIANAAVNAVSLAKDADYLRYAEEVAIDLINREFGIRQPLVTASDLVSRFSYAPEIQKFIRILCESLII